MVDAAYLAGIIDGEGSVILYKRREVVAVMLTVSNTAKQLLDWIADKTGVGAVCSQYKETEKRKATWFWRCNADAAESVLQQIRPYLVLKSAQADLALATQKQLRDPGLKATHSWQMEYLDKMRALNKRGPVTIET